MSNIAVPSTNQIQSASLESLINKAKLGVPLIIPGSAYIQSQGATSSITSIASIFKDASSIGQRTFPAGFWQSGKDVYDKSAAGAVIKLTSYGTVSAATTPTLTVSLGQTVAGTFTDYTGSTATGAVATIFAGAHPYKLELYMWCPVYGAGTTGTIATIGSMYFPTADLKTIGCLEIPYAATASLDTTLGFTLECKLTATASAAFIPYLNLVEVLN